MTNFSWDYLFYISYESQDEDSFFQNLLNFLYNSAKFNMGIKIKEDIKFKTITFKEEIPLYEAEFKSGMKFVFNDPVKKEVFLKNYFQPVYLAYQLFIKFQALKEELKRLRGLVSLLNYISQETDKIKAFQTFTQKVKEFLDADHVSLFSYSDYSKKLYPFGFSGSPFRKEKINEGIQIGEEVLGVVALSKEAIHLRGLKFNPWAISKEGEEGEQLTAPILWQGELQGVINIEVGSGKSLDEDKIKLLFEILPSLGGIMLREKLLEEISMAKSNSLENFKMRTIGELASDIAHEITTPLTIIKGISEMSLEDPNLPENIREDLNKIKQSADKARDILLNLLSYSRIWRSEEIELINLKDELRGIVNLIKPSLNRERIQIHLEMDENLTQIYGSRAEFSELMLNLINNAKDAIKEKGSEGNIYVRAGFEGESIFVEVEDDGTGIPHCILDRIFEPYFTTKKDSGGTGLGLTLVKKIADKMGGKIYVISREEEGTIFKITLKGQKGEGSGNSEKEGTSLERKVLNKKVLVVDDEKEIVDVLIKMLNFLGVEAKGTTNPLEALLFIQRDIFDLIILDVKMPEIDGVELYKMIKDQNPQNASRVVFLTGDIGRLEYRTFFEQEKVPLIIKPVSLETLRKLLLSE